MHSKEQKSLDYQIMSCSCPGSCPLTNIMKQATRTWVTAKPEKQVELVLQFPPSIPTKMKLYICMTQFITVEGRDVDIKGNVKYSKVYTKDEKLFNEHQFTLNLESTTSPSSNYLTELRIQLSNPDPALMKIHHLIIYHIPSSKRIAVLHGPYLPINEFGMQLGKKQLKRNNETHRIGYNKRPERECKTTRKHGMQRNEEEELNNALAMSKIEYEKALELPEYKSENNEEYKQAIEASLMEEEHKEGKEGEREIYTGENLNIGNIYNLRARKEGKTKTIAPLIDLSTENNSYNDLEYQATLLEVKEQSRKTQLRESGYAYLGRKKEEKTKKATGPGQRIKRTDCHEGHLCEYLLWDYVIYLHGYTDTTRKEELLKKRMEDLVPYMGGFISTEITNEVTHIVVKDENAAKELLHSLQGDVIFPIEQVPRVVIAIEIFGFTLCLSQIKLKIF